MDALTVRRVHRLGRDAPRHDPDRTRREAVLDEAVRGRPAGTEHEIRGAAPIQAASHHAGAPSREALGGVDERDVVHRDHMWARRGRRDRGRRVTHVDRSRRLLDPWPLEPVPRLVEDGSPDRESSDLDGRSERGSGWTVVSTGDADHLDVRTVDQSTGDLQGRRRRAAGYTMPTLLEGVGDAQRLGHRSIMPNARYVRWFPRRTRRRCRPDAAQVAATTPAATAGARYASANVSTVSCAFSPLGLGTTQRRAPRMPSGCSPIVAFGSRKAAR